MDDLYTLQMQAVGEMSARAAPQVTYEDSQHNTLRENSAVLMDESAGIPAPKPTPSPADVTTSSNLWMYALLAAAAFLLFKYLRRS